MDAAHPTGKRYPIWDCDLRGFGHRIEPSGIKTFIAKYRVGGGGRNAPQRIQTIGRYGTLTPEEARRKAKVVLCSVAAGADPQGDLPARRREMNMAALIDFYETHGCVVQRGKLIGEPMKPLTKAYTLARLRHHVVPHLGNRRARDVTSGDIERFAADVAAGKTGQSTRPMGTAALTLLKQIERTEDSEFVFPADTGEGH